MGIVAHVDAGKTTLTESLLYNSGSIRKMGRVDHKDAFLDFDVQERNRGITIYSKTATFDYNQTTFTIVDTPGHVDFSAEMERTLQILDKVILVINGQSGVQSHTETIWKLLEYYSLPVFIFVNKMDSTVYSKEELLADISKNLSGNCIDFSLSDSSVREKVAMSDERLLDRYLADEMNETDVINAIENRKVFPVFFGSALKNEGIEELLQGLDRYKTVKKKSDRLSLRVYKVAYDSNGTRLCYCRILSGSLSAKQKITEELKVDQIYLLNGEKSILVSKAETGMVVAVKGLDGLVAGSTIGIDNPDEKKAVLTAYMNYHVIIPKGTDINMMLRQLNILAEEDPQIKVSYEESLKEIHLQLMGEIQLEIIKNVIKSRTGVDISFDNGKVLFKETILNTVEGVGHFEPLRHYAEVHLKLQPLPLNSGLVFESELSTDELAGNWQNLILTHMAEKQHKGVLTGSPITDMKISLIAGRAHLKHTEGGDFRQATYRAIRQGLKKADSIILEPFYDFSITVDSPHLSKVLFDLESMNATVSIQQLSDDMMMVTGRAAVRKLQNYQLTLTSYTSGKGKIQLYMSGYDICREQQEIINMFNYDSERDMSNPTGSVFCAHGAGFYVPYNLVEEYMHIKPMEEISSVSFDVNRSKVSDSELKQVFNNINGRNRNENKKMVSHQKVDDDGKKSKVIIQKKKETMMFVDGYNMVFGWDKTKQMAESDIDLARDMVIKQLASYAGYRNCQITVVFDAYKRADNPGSSMKTGGINVVYTRSNETADSYIERESEKKKKDYNIIVVSSDAMVQSVALGNGAVRMSVRELMLQIEKEHK